VIPYKQHNTLSQCVLACYLFIAVLVLIFISFLTHALFRSLLLIFQIFEDFISIFLLLITINFTVVKEHTINYINNLKFQDLPYDLEHSLC
jgi:cobalamin biosynthesis protein CobD/CbiB